MHMYNTNFEVSVTHTFFSFYKYETFFKTHLKLLYKYVFYHCFLKGMPPFKEDKDPALVYLSHFSLLDLSDKEMCNSDYVKSNMWSHDSGSHDEGHNLFQTPSSYDSQQDTDSVPYATVVFSGPYQNQMGSPPVYLRSESTQPLLGVEEPGSPPPYENMLESFSKVNYFTTFPLEPTENEALWEDFPMLRSLEIRNTDKI